MVEGKRRHNLVTIIHAVRRMWYTRYRCGLVEWECFYDERSGSSGEGGIEGEAEEFAFLCMLSEDEDFGQCHVTYEVMHASIIRLRKIGMYAI